MGKDHELLEAARTGNISVVEKLLHSKSKSSTFAASFGWKTKVKKWFKIRVGANINCQDQNGYTPLHHASLNGHSEIVELLLEVGASVNTPDIKGSCPLHLAAWNGIPHIVRILLTNGPSFASVNDQNGDKETALHCSAQHGHQDSVKILLDNHADPKLRNIRDESALDLASQYGRLEVVRLLLTFHPKLLAHSPERFTPLHLASRNGHRGVVELLLVHGADINKVGTNGTALHEAALFGKYGVVSLLLKRGGDPNAKDSSGRTSLELVSQLDTQTSRDIAKLIIVRIQDGEDYQPLRAIVTSTPNKSKKPDTRAKNVFDKPTNVFDTKAKNVFNKSTKTVFATISGTKVSRNLSRSFGEADLASRELSRGRPSFSTSLQFSRTPQMSPDSSKTTEGHRIRASLLRRTSSARSARSLPRIVSTASFHGNRSIHSFSHGKKSETSMQDWSIRQHHPSIDMFPVTPTRASQTSRRTSTSEPSSPQLGSAMFSSSFMDTSDNTEVIFHDTPHRVEDDSVFFPGTPTSGRPSFETFLPSQHTSKKVPKTVIPLKPPAEDSAKKKYKSSLEERLSLLISSDIPPPLPKKISSPPLSVVEPKSPVLLKTDHTGGTKTNENTSISKEVKTNSLKNVDLDNSSKTIEGHSISKVEDESALSHSFNTSISSMSDYSPTLRSPGAPLKPQRHKPDLTPPPLPPKPAHMSSERRKPRPPSPSKPPPLDDEEDDDDIFEDALSLSSIEGTQATTPILESIMYDPRFKPYEATTGSLSPPSYSSNSESTSTISTVIFVSSPVDSECGNTDLEQTTSNTVESSNTVSKDEVSETKSNADHSICTAKLTPHKPKDIEEFKLVVSGDSQSTSHQCTLTSHNAHDTPTSDNAHDTPRSDNAHDTPTSKYVVSSPTLQSPSPPFSPPSPNTAMLQVSSAIQKIVTCNQAKPTEKSSTNNTSMHSSITTIIQSPSSELTRANKPPTNTPIENTNPTIKPALPKKKTTSLRQPHISTDKNVIKTLSQKEDETLKTNVLSSKSMSSILTPSINLVKPSAPVATRSVNIMSPKPYENGHKSVLVRQESSNLQLRPQSELYYTATEVKRARICSTRSVIEIPLLQPNSECDNVTDPNESQITRNRRSSSLGPQVKALYPEPKPMNIEIEVQTVSPVRRVSDAYTQTYPPKLSMQRKLSLQKSKSVDRFYYVTPKENGSTCLQLAPKYKNYVRASNFSVAKSQITVPKIKQPLVTTPPSAIRAKKIHQKPTKPTKPAHLLNYKPTIKSKEIAIHKESNVKQPEEFLNDDVFKSGLDESFNSVTSVLNSSSLADKTVISVLSLDTSTDDWNDALSDRTDDMNIPKKVRKYRGLIRGSSLSYRSRFASCGGAKGSSYDSDEFEYDYKFDSKAAYSRVNASLQPDDDIDLQKHSSIVTKLSKNTGDLQQTHLGGVKNITISDNLMDEKCNIIPTKKTTKNNIGEPGEKRRKEDLLLRNINNTVTSQEGGFINYAHSRDSSYDNNNNNNNRDEENKQSTSTSTSSNNPSIAMTTAPILSSPMSEGLPDFGTIVDTVTAVRKKTSPQGSTSGVSSTSSSKSSTLAKQDPTLFNENDEWAQIANVMKSVGNTLNKGSVYAQEFEETFWRIMTGSNLPRRVEGWLSDLNLSQYEEVICGNGFDNVNFLASEILEEQDLIDMNIQNVTHRRRMLDSAKNLPKIRPLASFSDAVADPSDERKAPTSVGDWLRSLAIGDNEETFITMGFNTLDKLTKMKDTEIAGIVRLRGHRKRIRASLGHHDPQLSSTKLRTTSQSSIKTTKKLKSSPPLPRSPLLDKVNFFKDYSQKTNNTQSVVANSYGTASSSSSALTNCSAASDQVVPIAISEEVETIEFPTRFNRSHSSNTEPHHRRHSRDKKTDLNRFPSLPSGSLSHSDHKTDNFTQNSNIFDLKNNNPEEDLLTQAISRLTDNSVKKPGNTQEQDKENMSTSDSNEVRVPSARRASYLSSNGDLILRPPNETTDEEVNVSSWCHDPETLIKSCCNYQAYYLGSMLVHEVKGVESTVEACAKMKKSTDSMKKIPTVTLSISYKGVKFIDSKSKHEIAEHEIQNISFASQDADDLSTLAYITRDAKTDNHYCHVFRVTSLDVAYEIILTLGQAFEVAYQLILKEKEMQKENP